MGIAVGSSTQLATFVLPLCVIFAWIVDAPLSLNLHPFEACTMLVAILLVGALIQGGESHYLAGTVLVVAYCIVATAYFFHIDLV